MTTELLTTITKIWMLTSYLLMLASLIAVLIDGTLRKVIWIISGIIVFGGVIAIMLTSYIFGL